MPKKRKRPLGAEGPPSATIAEINEVLLAPKRQFAAPVEAQRKPKAKARSAPMAAAKSAPKSAPAAPAAKSAPSAKGVDGSKLALELLEATTTQLLRRKGWFRDVRLRRSAEAFMRSSKLFQKAGAAARQGHVRPGPELTAYEQELLRHLEGLRGKLGAVPMNEAREISLKSSGPGQVIGAKLKGLKKRAAELEKKPRSVIKGAGLS
ncbi:unnamed protein product [Effrenium voratum]|uniref:Uncharacterized protein n=1 Tax=Effrenium voratum TaxID=2562239 RepID=A0AA36IT67_9DINO|nr:unnamed protein product [Effrenium voratum]